MVIRSWVKLLCRNRPYIFHGFTFTVLCVLLEFYLHHLLVRGNILLIMDAESPLIPLSVQSSHQNNDMGSVRCTVNLWNKCEKSIGFLILVQFGQL